MTMETGAKVDMTATPKDGLSGIRRLVRSMRVTIAGLRWAFRNEEAVRLEVIGLLFLVPVALWLGNSGIERALLIASLFLVLIVELINSAVEATVDRIGTERHPLSGAAKDLGSAAVFVALVNAVVVWLLVLFL